MESTPTAVIISTYNSPEYLQRVLYGYINQTVLPDELLVADDGSTDETKRVIDDAIKVAPFPIRHIWHEDAGFRLARIRNLAVKDATSDYIVISDGDCVPHPLFVHDHKQLAKPGWFFTGKRMLVSQQMSSSFSWQGITSAAKACLSGGLSGCHHLLRLPWFVRERKGFMGLRGCNMAMYRADLLAVNGFNEQIVGWGREDSELAARLFAYGLRRREAPFAAMVFHLWHKENERTHLDENDRLLKEAVESGEYRCLHGIGQDGTIRNEV